MTDRDQPSSEDDQLIACIVELSSELMILKASLDRGDRLAARAQRAALAERIRAFETLIGRIANQAHLEAAHESGRLGTSGEQAGVALRLGAAARTYAPTHDNATQRAALPSPDGLPGTSALSRDHDAWKALTPSVVNPTPVRLPNASVGRSLDYDLEHWLGLPATADIEFQALPPGLHVDDRMHLVGTPSHPGEYRGRWSDRPPTKQGEILLTVNADPRSLWQNIPSDSSAPSWKPDSVSVRHRSPVAQVIAASVRGRSHAHIGSFREDDFCLHIPEAGNTYGWHIFCVTDGAGSAKMSRRGSKLAADTMVARLRDLLAEENDLYPVDSDLEENSLQTAARELNARSLDAMESDKSDAPFWTPRLYQVLATAANHAQAAIRAESDANHVPIRDYATTLLATIVRRTRQGAWFVGSYWVGDGAIGMWRADWSAPKLFGEPESGEYAGQTTFFTAEDFGRSEIVLKRLRYTLVESFDFLALMTDGVSDPKFPTEHLLKQVGPWEQFRADLQEVLAEARADDGDPARRLLDWMDFWSSGNHDDRTLLLMVP